MDLNNIIAVRTNKVIYRDGDKAIKVFDRDFSKSDVLNEALNQSRVEETGLNVPKIIEVLKIDGQWAIVYDYIEGKTLAKLTDENPEKASEYLETLVDIQIEIHSKQCYKLNKMKDKMEDKISRTAFDATIRYELQTRLASMPNGNSVCHGDLTPGNVIIKPDGSPYIIDWAHATQGSASADAARTYLRFRLAACDDWAETYLRLFCKKSNTARQYIHRWLPIVAASQSVKKNKDEAELLTKWVNVVEYE